MLSLRYEGHRIFKGKAPLAGLPSAYTESEDEAETLEIDLRDALTGALVTLSYTVYRDFDVLARSMRVRNEGGKPFEIKGLQAAAVRLPKAEYDVMNLKGAWAREREVMRTGMPQGTFAIERRRVGAREQSLPGRSLPQRERDGGRGIRGDVGVFGQFPRGRGCERRRRADALHRLFARCVPLAA